MELVNRLIPILGLLVIMGLAWLIGDRSRKISYRIVIGGLLLQFALALFILKTWVGAGIFTAIGELAAALLGYVGAGSAFVFGAEYAHHFFAFRVLPTIIFISSLMAILYHLGVLQRVIVGFAWVMQRTLRTSGSETLAAAANVFIGQTEAPLVIRPYVAAMTRLGADGTDDRGLCHHRRQRVCGVW